MPVTVENRVLVVDIEGKEHEGKAIADQLLAIKKDDDTVVFGRIQKVVAVHTVITCDSEWCDRGVFNPDCTFSPKVIEFDDIGDPNVLTEEVRGIGNWIGIDGAKKCFCSQACAAGWLRRTGKLEGKNILNFPPQLKKEPGCLFQKGVKNE